MYKDPIYFYFIVPTILLLLQIMVIIVLNKLKEVLLNLFKVQDSDIERYIIPERNNKQKELLKQGGENA